MQRILLMFPILFGVSVLIFLIIHLVPGSPGAAILGIHATQERIAEIERDLGLHQPLVVQYFDWLSGVLTGDFGQSYTFNAPVADILVDRFWVSFEMIVLMFVFSTILAIPIGILAAVKHQTGVDYASMSVGVLGVSMPMFFSGVLLILVFGVWLDILPTGGYVPISEDPVEHFRHLVLPVITLSFGSIAVIVRMMRSSMLETLGEEYVRFLKAKGLSRRSILLGHAVKNSFIPVVTLMGLRFGYMLSGTVIVEEIFAIPGLGRTVVQATLERDYPLIQGTVLLIAVWFSLVNLVTDLSVSYFDPRVMEEDT